MNVDALAEKFGFTLREEQSRVLNSLWEGKDVFCLMGTGSGKSVGFQGISLSGRFVIILEPLIALMQDQYKRMQQLFLRNDIPAESVGLLCGAAGLAKERRAAMEQLVDLEAGAGRDGRRGTVPRLRALFTTPETLFSDVVWEIVKRLSEEKRVGLFAVDEAHCISTWGHDFRPAMRSVRRIREEALGVPILALTATATEGVASDIVGVLGMHDPVRIVGRFDRPEIAYEVRYKDAILAAGESTAVLQDLRELVSSESGCAVVYCHRRADVDDIASFLSSHGVGAVPYHAGLSASERHQAQAAWSAGRAHAQVVVATIAFGMGIDKADVRLVVHWSVPASLAGLYQESGRAGRDGLPSRAVLYFGWADWCRLAYLSQLQTRTHRVTRRPDPATGPFEVDSDTRSRIKHPLKCDAERLRRGGKAGLASLVEVARYCLAARCRRRALVEHFGQTMPLSARCRARHPVPGAAPALPFAAAAGNAAGNARYVLRAPGCDACRDFAAVTRRIRAAEHAAPGSSPARRSAARGPARLTVTAESSTGRTRGRSTREEGDGGGGVVGPRNAFTRARDAGETEETVVRCPALTPAPPPSGTVIAQGVDAELRSRVIGNVGLAMVQNANVFNRGREVHHGAAPISGEDIQRGAPVLELKCLRSATDWKSYLQLQVRLCSNLKKMAKEGRGFKSLKVFRRPFPEWADEDPPQAKRSR